MSETSEYSEPKFMRKNTTMSNTFASIEFDQFDSNSTYKIRISVFSDGHWELTYEPTHEQRIKFSDGDIRNAPVLKSYVLKNSATNVLDLHEFSIVGAAVGDSLSAVEVYGEGFTSMDSSSCNGAVVAVG